MTNRGFLGLCLDSLSTESLKLSNLNKFMSNRSSLAFKNLHSLTLTLWLKIKNRKTLKSVDLRCHSANNTLLQVKAKRNSLLIKNSAFIRIISLCKSQRREIRLSLISSLKNFSPTAQANKNP